MKYPIGIQSFQQIREEGFVYVDKTDLIYKLADEGKIYFLSRPRRFGKSLLVSTLKCYFEGKRELFKGLKIDSLERDWKQYPVFFIDFNGTDFSSGVALHEVISGYVKKWESVYGANPFSHDLGDRFSYVLHAAHLKTGLPCVVLIDEYDKPLLDVLDTGLMTRVEENEMLIEDKNRNTLKSFYSVFKKADADLKFVLLTGVTKFPQVSVFSGFNQPFDISMSGEFDAICGITKDELVTIFASPIEEMAANEGVSSPEMLELLQLQYDGYHFSTKMTDIFNPFSLLNAFKNKEIQDYWFRTGTPTYLVRLLNHTHENLNDLTGKYYDASQFIDYRANIEKPLPMFYQSGYLTIKGYERDDRTYLLDFPNNEVKRGFLSIVSADYLKPTEDPMSWLIRTQRCLKRGNLSEFKEILDSFLSGIPYSARRHENEREKERYFQYTIYLLMRMISCYTVYHEKETSQGRADCVIETPDYVYIFEYKLDNNADVALEQIDRMGYAREYAKDRRTIYKVACCFSSETGTVCDFKAAKL